MEVADGAAVAEGTAAAVVGICKEGVAAAVVGTCKEGVAAAAAVAVVAAAGVGVVGGPLRR